MARVAMPSPLEALLVGTAHVTGKTRGWESPRSWLLPASLRLCFCLCAPASPGGLTPRSSADPQSFQARSELGLAPSSGKRQKWGQAAPGSRWDAAFTGWGENKAARHGHVWRSWAAPELPSLQRKLLSRYNVVQRSLRKQAGEVLAGCKPCRGLLGARVPPERVGLAAQEGHQTPFPPKERCQPHRCNLRQGRSEQVLQPTEDFTARGIAEGIMCACQVRA